MLIAGLSTGAPPLGYRASGRPVALPVEQLADVTPREFAGILVGLRGRPVVVNVWATWCPPCRAEMPLLERAANDFEGRVTFLGLATKDSRDAATAFLDDVGVEYPNVFDASGQVRSELQMQSFPTTYFFDAEGVLREAVVGGITEQRLAAQLEELLV